MGQPFVTTDAVLLEVGNALGRNFKQEAIGLIQEIFDSPNMEIVRLHPDLFERAFELYRTHNDKTWGLVDCISFVVMRDAGLSEALTCDHHFVQAGFRALMTLDTGS